MQPGSPAADPGLMVQAPIQPAHDAQGATHAEDEASQRVLDSPPGRSGCHVGSFALAQTVSTGLWSGLDASNV
jgi:hypothetical protein